MLLGDRPHLRLGEEVAKRLAWLFPAQWRAVQASQVASALVRAALADELGVKILDNARLIDEPA